MDLQEIAIYIILGIAIVFLVKKFFYKSKSKNGCDTDCGCS